MKPENRLAPPQETKQRPNLAETLRELEEKCRNCNPISPLSCVTDCATWKLKNEYRKSYEKMKDPNFTSNLLNTLKNKRRLQILGMISKAKYSTEKLQRELKESGYQHSQQTITKEYMEPLIDVGLAQEDRNQYYATTIGTRIHNIIGDFDEIEDVLPPHSECYEEQSLRSLLSGPRTFEELGNIIPLKSVSRVLHRLEESGLIENGAEKDYVFFFKTLRDPNKESVSSTERKVYTSIPAEGISARKLADKAEISLRRTYKYVRKLKGKKLVFARKRPRAYTLSVKGIQLAESLEKIHCLVAEILTAKEQVAQDIANLELQVPRSSVVQLGNRMNRMVSFRKIGLNQRRFIKHY